MVRKLLRWLFVLYWAVVLTVLSLQVHYPMGKAARGADCLPECMDPTEQWGFPLLYIQETFVTSVGRDFHLWPFLGNVLLYAVLLGWFLRKLPMPRLTADLLVKAAFWPLMLLLLLQWDRNWPLLGVIGAVGLWQAVMARNRGSLDWWLSMAVLLFGGFFLSRTWMLEPHMHLLMVWSAVFWLGLNVPAPLKLKNVLMLLGLTVLTGLWWYTLADGPFLAALGTHLAGSALGRGLFWIWISMYMAPQMLFGCLERWKFMTRAKERQQNAPS